MGGSDDGVDHETTPVFPADILATRVTAPGYTGQLLTAHSSYEPALCQKQPNPTWRAPDELL